LPILHDVQAEFGYIPQDCLPHIALALNISRAEVHGVVTFYHDFRETPAGRHVVKLCRAEACQAMGGDALAAHARAKLGVDWHETSASGAVTLEPVFCLGLCACAPAAMVDGKLIARLDKDRLDTILGDLA
jgi:formate dehydrogenase subunit gamma